jgi:hypothetical protein
MVSQSALHGAAIFKLESIGVSSALLSFDWQVIYTFYGKHNNQYYTEAFLAAL